MKGFLLRKVRQVSDFLEKGWQFTSFIYTEFMLKLVNVISIYIFVLVASAAPYISAKGAALAFAQNPEERTFSNSNFEEEIHHSDAAVFPLYNIVSYSPPFPNYLELVAQNIIIDILKPPSA